MASSFFSSRFLLLIGTLCVSHLSPVHAGLRIWGIKGSNLVGDPGNPPDPYVKVWYGNAFGGMTEFFRDVASPVFKSEFNFPNARAGDDIHIEVWDKDLIHDDFLGRCSTSTKGGSFTVTCKLNAGSVTYSYRMS